MTVTRILALVALGLAVASFFVTQFPLLPVAVVLLAVAEIVRG